MRNTAQKRTEKGFTLIEMAIVITIIGMILGSVAQLYSQRLKFLQMEDGQDDIAAITLALGGFLDINGRFPCPASLTAKRGEVIPAGQTGYGRETDCSDGVAHTIPATGLFTTADNVRIGAVPFKELGLEENDAIDGYHNRLIYAVTESQAVQTEFELDGGVITLLNEDADLANPVAEKLNYVLYSTGENGAGAYTREGAQLQPCRLVAREAENCDFNNSTFISAQHGTAANDMEFDDIINYNTLSDMPKWEETGGPTDDINAKADGNLGIGPGGNLDSEEELDVIGIIRAQDNPDTADVEGNVNSSNLCESRQEDGDGNEITKCFPSALIGNEGAPHPDMECPSGQFMLAIANGKAECSSSVEVACPIGQFMVGINADGTPKCDIPLDGCPSVSVLVCSGEPETTLLKAEHGDTQYAKAGLSRSQKYVCNNGNWQKSGNATGLCTCTPGVTKVTAKNCSYGSWNTCGVRFSGTYDYTTTRQCPSGKLVNTSDRSSCTCVESVKTTWPGCPWGYNTGYIKRTNTHDCTTQKCGGNVDVINTCGCLAKTETRWVNCPSGFDGQYKEEKKTTCPDGEFGKYSQGGWKEVEGYTQEDRCTCAASKYTTPKACPVGQTGDIDLVVEYVCNSPSTSPERLPDVEIVNSPCVDLPPIQCKWQWPTGALGEDLSTYPAGILEGTQTCDCDSEQGDKRKCAKQQGSKYVHENCVCEVTSGG